MLFKKLDQLQAVLDRKGELGITVAHDEQVLVVMETAISPRSGVACELGKVLANVVSGHAHGPSGFKEKMPAPKVGNRCP